MASLGLAALIHFWAEIGAAAAPEAKQRAWQVRGARGNIIIGGGGARDEGEGEGSAQAPAAPSQIHESSFAGPKVS